MVAQALGSPVNNFYTAIELKTLIVNVLIGPFAPNVINYNDRNVALQCKTTEDSIELGRYMGGMACSAWFQALAQRAQVPIAKVFVVASATRVKECTLVGIPLGIW